MLAGQLAACWPVLALLQADVAVRVLAGLLLRQIGYKLVAAAIFLLAIGHILLRLATTSSEIEECTTLHRAATHLEHILEETLCWMFILSTVISENFAKDGWSLGKHELSTLAT